MRDLAQIFSIKTDDPTIASDFVVYAVNRNAASALLPGERVATVLNLWDDATAASGGNARQHIRVSLGETAKNARENENSSQLFTLCADDARIDSFWRRHLAVSQKYLAETMLLLKEVLGTLENDRQEKKAMNVKLVDLQVELASVIRYLRTEEINWDTTAISNPGSHKSFRELEKIEAMLQKWTVARDERMRQIESSGAKRTRNQARPTLRCYVEDGSYKSVVIDASTTVQALCKMLSVKMDRPPHTLWEASMVTPTEKRILATDDKPVYLMAYWNDVNAQKAGGNDSYQFYFESMMMNSELLPMPTTPKTPRNSNFDNFPTLSSSSSSSTATATATAIQPSSPTAASAVMEKKAEYDDKILRQLNERKKRNEKKAEELKRLEEQAAIKRAEERKKHEEVRTKALQMKAEMEKNREEQEEITRKEMAALEVQTQQKLQQQQQQQKLKEKEKEQQKSSEKTATELLASLAILDDIAAMSANLNYFKTTGVAVAGNDELDKMLAELSSVEFNNNNKSSSSSANMTDDEMNELLKQILQS